jgi:hypothetical protein
MPYPLRLFLSLVVLAACVVAGFFALNAYIYREKQGDGANVDRYRGTLTGEVVCLPHRDTSGPQTLECAMGLRTESGEYYAVDFNLMSQEHSPIETGERFTANGMVTPVEMLSSDHWQRYAIEGIFSVTDSLVVER